MGNKGKRKGDETGREQTKGRKREESKRRGLTDTDRLVFSVADATDQQVDEL